MWKQTQRRTIGIFFVTTLTTIALIGHSHGQNVTPSQSVRPNIRVPSPSGSQQPQTPSPYTTRLNCPDGAKLAADIPVNIRPPGWPASYSSGALVLGSVEIGSFQGKQDLECKYNTQWKPGGYVVSLRRSVELNSCIAAPDKKSFLCKPGVN